MNNIAATDDPTDSFISYLPDAKTGEETLWMEGVPLASLAAEYGTPLYCYSAGSIRHAIAQYRQALATLPFPVAIHYAAKANSRLGILELMREEGLGLDVVSCGEIRAAERAGFKGEAIIYSGVGKTMDDLAYALNHGIKQLNVESRDEIAMLLKVASAIKPTRKINVAVRVNPDIAAGGHEKISTGKAGDKFGIASNEVLSAYRLLAQSPFLSPSAIAMHIGSQLTDGTVLTSAYKKLTSLIEQLWAEDIAITTADIGGGLAIRYKNEQPMMMADYAHLLTEVFHPLAKRGLKNIVIEPGRSLVGRSGILLCRIILQKQSGGKDIVVVDAAMNDLIRPTLYQAYHGLLPVARKLLKNNNNNNIDKITTDVVGGICESGDYLALQRPLPKLQNGDILAICQAGAYATVMASNYNHRMLPAEVMVDGKHHRIIKLRQDFDDFLKTEKLKNKK